MRFLNDADHAWFGNFFGKLVNEIWKQYNE